MFIGSLVHSSLVLSLAVNEHLTNEQSERISNYKKK
jgi:hypothetical protein